MEAGKDRVLRRMRRQHGVVSRAQALHGGMTRAQIESCLRSGRWVREARGVYRHEAAPLTPLSRMLAACLAHGGLASHRSAAALHGIEGFTLARIELSVPRGRKRVMSGIMMHESTQMELARPVYRSAVPCTRLDRTVLDLAAVVIRNQLERAIDAVLRDRRLTRDDLVGVLLSHSRKGRNGCAAFRTVLADRLGGDPVPLSAWSRMVAELLVEAGLPDPALEYRVRNAVGDFVAQVDLAYPARGVAIELDSRRWHHNSDSFVQDRRRRNQITLAGWTVLNFTWDDYRDRPGDLCAQVAAAHDEPSAIFQ